MIEHYLMWSIIATVSFLIVLTVSCYLAEKHGKRDRLEQEMAQDYVRQFGGTLADAQWIVKNARPKK